MNAHDERRFRSTWEPEVSTLDELDSPTRRRRRAWTARLSSGLAVAFVAVIAFLAGVALGPILQHDGQPAAVVSATGPATVPDPTPAITGALYDDGWAGARLGSAVPSRTANGRHP